MTKAQIEQMEGMTIYFEGVSRNGDDWMVFGNDSLQIIARNQGEHDERFFDVNMMMDVEEAIAKAKYFCER